MFALIFMNKLAHPPSSYYVLENFLTSHLKKILYQYHACLYVLCIVTYCGLLSTHHINSGPFGSFRLWPKVKLTINQSAVL